MDLSEELVSSLIDEYKVNPDFAVLSEPQQIQLISSGLQTLANLYNAKELDAFASSNLESPVPPVPVLSRVFFVDASFVGLPAPYFTTAALAIAYINALTIAPSAAHPVVVRSFSQADGSPVNWGAYDLMILEDAGIFVRTINEDRVGPVGPAGANGAGALFTTPTDVTATRNINTVYHNSLDVALFVAITVYLNGGSGIAGHGAVAGGIGIANPPSISIVQADTNGSINSTPIISLTFVVPPNYYYQVGDNSEGDGTAAIVVWVEIG